MAAEPVVLGRITGLFGVRGWVKVFSHTEPREAVLEYDTWLLGRDGHWEPTTVAEGQRHGKTVIVRLANIDDREQAAGLIGAEIGVSREAMPAPEDGHYYWWEIIGLEVVHKDGARLGQVEAMLETGAHDVMLVKSEHEERLIPFVKDKFILDVDLAQQTISVDWEWD